MQARAEGAVRICKEHVRCLLKASNAPARFWPFALLHWCRIYNYWPGSKTPPPWDAMEKSKFYFNMEWDLQPWACYMAAKLLLEHPLVKESTHSDRALEGVFLGWHDTTPSCWMYSVKEQCILKTCIISPGTLTADQVNEMHATDLSSGEWMVEEDEMMSAAPTQPALPKQKTVSEQEDGGA
eukprot:2390636-Rhodomonas_salina.1